MIYATGFLALLIIVLVVLAVVYVYALCVVASDADDKRTGED